VRITSIILQTLTITFIALTGLTLYTLLYPLPIPKQGAIFYVHPGMSRANLVSGLSEENIIRIKPIFDLYTLANGKVPKSGEYLIPAGATGYSLWKQLTVGSGRYYRAFAIIPGTTFEQVKAALLAIPYLKHPIAKMSNKDVMEAIGDFTHGPEGMFMPETYYYSRGDSDLAILRRAYDTLVFELLEAWNKRSKDLPYKESYQALIAASLIEKEAYLQAEQPIIAGVLVNRLNKNMLLQFDPTIIYGLGSNYKGKIYKTDLTTDTPYNTYLHKGLPPTPIAMPGKSAIEAATNPAKHDYYYFVAKGDGGHQFTTNLQDHYSAVQKAATLRATQSAVPAVTGGMNVTN
jgi:UPF0755 protein